MPLTIRGCGNSGGLEDRRHDVDDVVPLLTDLTLVLDPVRPVHDDRVAGTTVVGGHLLGPGEGGIEGHRPAGGHVRVGRRAAPVIVVLHHEVDVRALGLVVEVGHLVVQTVHPAFGARPIVAGDVEDQRVVDLAQIFDRLDHPAGLGIGHVQVGREDLGLAGEELLLLCREILPVLDVGRLGRELRGRRDDAELLLLLEDPFADHVPALVEAALLHVDIGLRDVVRGMDGTRGEVDEERLVRGERLLEAHPVDRLGRHVVHEVVVRIVRRLDAVLVAVDRRRPLVRLTAEEAVEFVEPLTVRPAVEGTGRADLPDRGLVPLAIGCGAVSVEAQHLADAGDIVGEHAGRAGEGGRHLGDLGLVGRVMVAAGLERLTRRRAEGGRVELVVHQPLAGELVEVRCVDHTAEGAGSAEADVVEQDDDDVRCILGRLDLEDRRRLGVPRVESGDRWVPGSLDRQFGSVDLCLLRQAYKRHTQGDKAQNDRAQHLHDCLLDRNRRWKPGIVAGMIPDRGISPTVRRETEFAWVFLGRAHRGSAIPQ